LTIDPSWLEPFWLSTVMRGESLMFVEGPGGSRGLLLFPADRVLSLTSCTGEVAYEEGRDYAVDAGQVRRLQGSRIPLTTREGLSRLIAADDDAFHRHQVAATYEHAAGLWTGPVPNFSGEQLPRTHARLSTSKRLTICLTGDSISEGYNASGFVGAPPHQPGYGALVAAGLERAYDGTLVTLHNFAVAGWTADNGRADAARVAAVKPDLVLVAYGMNDASYADAAYFGANIQGLLNEIRESSPAAEFVLVSPTVPSPECDFVVMDRFPAYRDALAKMSGQGTVLADMTTLWLELLERKTAHDLTGNGLNHPNDFGHRLYAQVILTLLVPPPV
jgi:acyl-CoA thioesterase-1